MTTEFSNCRWHPRRRRSITSREKPSLTASRHCDAVDRDLAAAAEPGAKDNAGWLYFAGPFQHGLCGTCETAVLEGLPDHRDTVLSARERESNRTMMICCSGRRGERLALDL